MQIIRDPKQLKTQGLVATIGNFDGLHRGHQHILKQLQATAVELGLPSALLSFEPHPQELLDPSHAPARLTRFHEKWQLLQTLRLDYYICLRFDKTLANLPAERFIEEILLKNLQIRHLLVGQDFRFGAKRQGDVALLQRYAQQHNFKVTVIPACLEQDQRISSSKIREYLQQGNFAAAEKMLGRPYTISGRVAHGQQRGRQLNFPTANIHLGRKKSLLHGVYLVKIHGLPETQYGVANLGTRPSVDQRKRFLLEVHILNFQQNLYGKRLKIEFVQKLRDEQRFPDLSALQTQIAQDVAQAKLFWQSSRS